LLLDFDRQSTVQTIIDNVRFVGTKKQVLHDLRMFVLRCRAVGATLNEFAADRPIGELAELVQQECVFMGRKLDHVAQTVALGEKQVEKVRAMAHHVGANPDGLTWRNVAGMYGLLFFAQKVQKLPTIAQYYDALREFSLASMQLSNGSVGWDSRATLKRSVIRQLCAWAEEVCLNMPRRLLQREDITDVICTDASKYGWGAIHLHLSTATVRAYGRRWPESFLERDTSTAAETRAVRMALCAAIPASEPRTVLILTDGSVTAHAIGRGHAKSFNVNRELAGINKSFPLTLLLARHVPGEVNIADGLSRGTEVVAAVDAARAKEFLTKHYVSMDWAAPGVGILPADGDG
jgi:hypothetical protein